MRVRVWSASLNTSAAIELAGLDHTHGADHIPAVAGVAAVHGIRTIVGIANCADRSAAVAGLWLSSRLRAHTVPTICPQLQVAAVICGEVFWLVEPVSAS